MELTSQLEELVQRTEKTEAEVELLLAELGNPSPSQHIRNENNSIGFEA